MYSSIAVMDNMAVNCEISSLPDVCKLKTFLYVTLHQLMHYVESQEGRQTHVFISFCQIIHSRAGMAGNITSVPDIGRVWSLFGSLLLFRSITVSDSLH